MTCTTQNFDNSFRGYIRCDEKKASKEKYRDVPSEQLRTLDRARILPNYAGVLRKDAICIDIDNMEDANIVLGIVTETEMHCRVHRTTKGMHFFFKNTKLIGCPTRVKLALGIEGDIKNGKEKACYLVLKLAGKEREVIYDSLNDDHEYDELPCWLRPVFCAAQFKGMTEGDGRNDALYKYIMYLYNKPDPFSETEIRETLYYINHCIFAEPLTDDELRVILRPESFTKCETDDAGEPVTFNDDKGKLDIGKLGDYLTNKYDMCIMDECLHRFEDAEYVRLTDFEFEPIAAVHVKGISNAGCRELLGNITRNAPVKEYASRDLIAFRNGVYNLKTGEFSGVSRELVFKNVIPWDYDETAFDANVDLALNRWANDDPAVRDLLCELIGTCMCRFVPIAKMFVLYGEGLNGKSSFVEILRDLLGTDNCCEVDFNAVNDDYNLIDFYGKLANIREELSDEYIPDTGILKTLSDGGRVKARAIYERPISFNNYATLIGCTNSIPNVRDKSFGIIRRFTIIPFMADFSGSDVSKDDFIRQIESDMGMSYLIKLGISAIRRVIENNAYTLPAVVKQHITDWVKDNNNVLQFLDYYPAELILGHFADEVFAEYTSYCGKRELKRYSFRNFNAEIRKALNCRMERAYRPKNYVPNANKSDAESGKTGVQVRALKFVANEGTSD